MLQLHWASNERHAQWLGLVLVGGVGAVALAVFGLPPVGIHGPLHHLGIMDPFCGMTRAVRSFARGELDAAWRYNPASFVLAALAAAVLVRAAVGLASRRWLEIDVVRSRAAIAVALPLVALLWFNQQQHMALLR
ncbi:MAG: DUF2752 domain-containing protein [Acidimicrobiia bacterium]